MPSETQDARPTLATYWSGEPLSDFLALCLRSWMAHGHRAALYSYEPIGNVPDGVDQRDAAEIMPRHELQGDDVGLHPAHQADIWRLAMLRAGVGIWCDSDVLLVRPIPAPQRLLIGREERGPVCNAVLWLPQEHRALREILDVFHARGLGPWAYAKPRWKRLLRRLSGQKPSFGDVPWNHWGRHAIEYYINKTSLRGEVLGYKSFYWPIVYGDALWTSTPYQEILDDPEVIGLHFFRKPTPAQHRDAPADSLLAWAEAQYGGGSQSP